MRYILVHFYFTMDIEIFTLYVKVVKIEITIL